MKLDDIDVDQDNILIEDLARNFMFKMRSQGGEIGRAARPIVAKYERELLVMIARIQKDVEKLAEMQTDDERGILHRKMNHRSVALFLIQDFLDRLETTGAMDR
jgi:hypothetical protein